MEFREFVIEWNYFAICETKKKKPGFRYNLPLSYSQKKKKNVIFFQQATSDYTVTIAHAKKKKTLSDTNYEGKKMYRNRKQHDICGKITRQRWLQIRALL